MDRSTIPWIAGGLAAAGLGYWLYRRKKKRVATSDAVAQQGSQTQAPAEETNLVHFPARY